MKTIKQQFLKYKESIPLLLLILLTIFFSRDFFGPMFIPTHDGEYHIIRFFEFDKMIRSGVYFPRWAEGLNNHFGVPLFNFVYPLPNYIGEIFVLLGFSLISSFKLTLATGFIVSGVTFYLMLKCFFSEKASFVAAIFYLLAPYHLLDLLIRGTPGEIWSLALAPLVIYFGYQKRFFWYGASVFLLTISHNILALMFVPLCLFFLLSTNKRELNHFLYMVLGILSSAFFWLPALWEKRYVVGLEQVDFKQHFPQFWQLLYPSWGSGFSGDTAITNQMSFQIGIPHLIIIVLAMILIFRQKKDKHRVLARNTIIILLLTIFLLLSVSKFVWEIVPLFPFFQYPWRFLSVVIFVSSFLCAWLINVLQKKYLFLFFLALSVVFYYPYTRPVLYQPRQDSLYLNNPNFTLGTNSPGNSFNTIWFNVKGDGRTKIKSNTDVTVELANIKALVYTYILEVSKSSEIIINTAFFPGWKVFEEGVEIKTDPGEDGLIHFYLNKGKHTVQIKFTDTTVRLVSKIISIISGIVIVFGLPRKKYESRIFNKIATK